MRSAKGFTLIELIAVIVILGILSVTAAPRLLNLQNDAKHAVMQQVRASLKFVVEGVYFKSVIQGTDGLRSTWATPYYTDVNGIQIQTYYGAPQEIWDDKLEHLMDQNFTYLGNAYKDSSMFTEVCRDAVCVVDQIKLKDFLPVSTEAYALAFFPKGHSAGTNCVVTYYFTAPESQGYADVHVDLIDSGC